MIACDDPHWRSTLPHLVRPLEDEWLVGLLLRCDLANGWTAGTTTRGLRRPTSAVNILDMTMGAFATGRAFDLPRLADLLAVPLGSLQQATFEAGLDRLRGPGQVRPRQLNVARPFQVCPACIAGHRLVARAHVLPLMDSCLEHGLLLQRVCPCGAHLRPFHRGEPFTCPECRAPWRKLPFRRVEDEALALNARFLTLFRFFLEHGDADSIGNALRAILAEMARRGLRRFPPIPREAAVPTNLWEQASVSLARVVGAMVALDLPPQVVRPRVPASKVPCLNRVCPRFGLVGEGNVHPFRCRAGVAIYYCSECGSQFGLDRLCSSFDEACSPSGGPPSRKDVATERARLAAWRKVLGKACVLMLAEDVPIAIASAFRRAGIPRRTRRLRATRLGLAGMVEQHAALQAEGVRERILAGWRDGMTRQQLAQTVGVSPTLVRQVVARRPMAPKGPPGCPRLIRVEQHGALLAQLEANRAATVGLLAKLWAESQGTVVHPDTMRNTIYRLGWRRIKRCWKPLSETGRA